MKRSLKSAAIGLLCLILCLPLGTGCRKIEKYTDSGFEWFDTFYTLTIYTESQEKFEEYTNAAHSVMEEYHRLLDIYHTYDGIVNLKSINDNAGGTSLEIDQKLGDFLAYAIDMHALTKGYTNIAMGAVTSLWHEARENADENKIGIPPQENTILEAMKHTDINALILSEDRKFVQLTDPFLSLDAGALGKGYTAERMSETLQAMGCESFLLNLGGNTVAYGTKTKNDPWLVAVDTPEHYKPLSNAIPLSGQALVTSGSYQRFFLADGIRYHHILHPETGWPSNHFVSVSVLSQDSALADALSTALFSMTETEGQALVESLPNTEAVWLRSDGSRLFSSGFPCMSEGTMS